MKWYFWEEIDYSLIKYGLEHINPMVLIVFITSFVILFHLVVPKSMREVEHQNCTLWSLKMNAENSIFFQFYSSTIYKLKILGNLLQAPLCFAHFYKPQGDKVYSTKP